MWRILRNNSGKDNLNKVDPPPLSRGVSRKIKAPKDNHGKRRGTDSN